MLQEGLDLKDSTVEDAHVDDEKDEDARAADHDEGSSSLSPPPPSPPKAIRPTLKRSHASDNDEDSDEDEDGGDGDDDSDSNYKETGKKSNVTPRRSKAKAATTSATRPVPRTGTTSSNGISSSLSPPTSSSSKANQPSHKRFRTSEDNDDNKIPGKTRTVEPKVAPLPKARRPRSKSKSKASPATPQTTPDPMPSVESGSALGPPSDPDPNAIAGRRVHPPPVEYKGVFLCPYDGCSHKGAKRNDVVRHTESLAHQEPSYPCGKCGRMFTRKDPQRRHESSNNKQCEKIWKEKLEKQRRDDNNGEGPSGT